MNKKMILKRAVIVFCVLAMLVTSFSACTISHNGQLSNEDKNSQVSVPNDTVHKQGEIFKVEGPVKAKETYSYDELKAMITDKLNGRNFTDEVNSLFMNTFEHLYENYEEWYYICFDLPERSLYIKKNLIDAIDSINDVEFYFESSPEGKRLLEDGAASGSTDIDRNILMICEDGEGVEDSQLFLHEVTHCIQKKAFDGEYFEDYTGFWDMLIEGGATYRMKFVTKPDSFRSGAWAVGNSDRTKTIEYPKNDCSGYLSYMHLYELTLYTTGYSIMEKVESGEEPITIIERSIIEKYGREKGGRFFELLKEFLSVYADSSFDDGLYACAVELENQFLDLLNDDIQKLDIEDPAQVRQFAENYRKYKLLDLPEAIDNDEIVTSELFDTDTTDRLLSEKIALSQAYGKFSDNAKLESSIIKAMLYVLPEIRYGDYYYHFSINIKDSSYIFAQNGDKACLIIIFERSEETQSFCFVLNEEGVESVIPDYDYDGFLYDLTDRLYEIFLS